MEQAEITKYTQHLPKKLQPSKDAEFQILPGGSDRQFIRIKEKDGAKVLMISDPLDKEFTNYLQVLKFLFDKRLGVPDVYFYDEACRVLLMEDIGDHSVEYLATVALKGDDVVTLYKGVVAFLAELQIEGYKDFEQCAPIKSRTYDRELMRWETNYFREYFLEKFCRIDAGRTRGLDKEFEHLIKSLASEQPFFMHRDFQSKNIFVKAGKVRIVDCQGARQGLLAYDLAAVLRDAYVILKDDTRQMLIDYYLTYLERIKGMNLDRNKFCHTFFLTAMQRNMQALGAFAFLSMVKGKKRYVKYIPAGVKYLQDALNSVDNRNFRKLKKVIEEDVRKVLAGSQVL